MSFAGPRDVRILMLGLDAAGKSTSECKVLAGGCAYIAAASEDSREPPDATSWALSPDRAVLYKLKLGEVITTIPTIGEPTQYTPPREAL